MHLLRYLWWKYDIYVAAFVAGVGIALLTRPFFMGLGHIALWLQS